ncbi:hypothetical protein AAI421_28300 (plasmid) [Rhodococcus aetherivorans]|uniref:hypothetical protein n=1 Tax=Rhodococcus aetherivorans TaxID=191292 RepID=UPI0031E28E39
MAMVFTHVVRILHPAYLDNRPVRWEEVGARTGNVVRATSTWYEVCGSARPNYVVEGVFDCPPEQGSLPSVLQQPVYERLTSVSEGLLWNGYNDPQTRRLTDSAPSIYVDTDEYRVIEKTDEAEGGSSLDVTPNYWWPSDHSWCAATGIDSFDTLIATSDARLAAEIVAIPGIEAFILHDP